MTKLSVVSVGVLADEIAPVIGHLQAMSGTTSILDYGEGGISKTRMSS